MDLEFRGDEGLVLGELLEELHADGGRTCLEYLMSTGSDAEATVSLGFEQPGLRQVGLRPGDTAAKASVTATGEKLVALLGRSLELGSDGLGGLGQGVALPPPVRRRTAASRSGSRG
jgi:hypothetical protein